jgi:hypothetical protein
MALLASEMGANPGNWIQTSPACGRRIFRQHNSPQRGFLRTGTAKRSGRLCQKRVTRAFLNKVRSLLS